MKPNIHLPVTKIRKPTRRVDDGREHIVGSNTTQGDIVIKKFSALGLAVALALIAHVGHAEEAQVTVRFSDLDIAHADGAAVLYGRISSAAKAICEPLDGRSLDEHRRFQWCVSDAIARAVLQVNQPALTKHYSRLVTPERDNVARAAW